MKKIFNTLLAILISGVLLFLLFRNIDIMKFFSTVKDADLIFIWPILGGFFLIYFSRALRFVFIFKKNIKSILAISIVHNFLNRLLPLRIGELSWPLLLRRYANVNYAEGLGALFFIRYLDLFVTILLFTLSSLLIRPPFFNTTILLILTAILSLQIFVMAKLNIFISSLIKILRMIKSDFFKTRKKNLLLKLSSLEEKLDKRNYIRLLMVLIPISFIHWLSVYLVYYSYVLMLNVNYSYVHVVIAASIVTIITNLPINSIGKFGTFELGWASGFILLGMSKNIAAPFGLFVNVSNTLISCLIAAAGYIFLITARKTAK